MTNIDTNLDNTMFLEALDAIKKIYTCGVCSEVCKNPVTLSSCLHVICEKHFDDLSACPECFISLKNCKKFTNERLRIAIDASEKLHDIYRPKNWKVSSCENKENSSNKDLNVKSALQPFNKSDNKEVNTSTLTSFSFTKLNKILEKRNVKGETALHVACRLGKVDKVLECLKEGANTNTKDNAGWTPLHEVVQNGRLELVKLLLQYNTLIDVPGPGNETPLHEAVRYNRKDIAAELVRSGADVYAKNCKGETPYQLANDEMKAVLDNAAENILQTQSVNINFISNLHCALDFDDIRVYCNSQHRSVNSKLKALLKSHSNLHLEARLTRKVTHLIVDADDNGICLSGCDVLQGIVYGVWVLTSKWVLASNEKILEHFKDYEVKGVGAASNNGPKNARNNKYKQLPGIFDGCHFYLHNFNTKYEINKEFVITKALLMKLIKDAGGVVLRRVPNPESIPESEALIPYHAKKDSKLAICSHYIIFKDIYEPMYNMRHLKALPIGWLIECLEKYELCEPW